MALQHTAPAHRTTHFAQAKAAFKAARLNDALELLRKGRDASLDATLLHARILVRRSPAESLALLAERGRDFAARDESARIALAEAVAFARLGDAASAKAKFARAARGPRADAAFAGEIAYQRGIAAWIARDLLAAERFAREAAPALRGDLALENAVLRGAIAASAGKLAEQGAILLTALDAARDPDAGTLQRATIAAQVGYLARELPSPALRDAAYREAAAIAWTADIGDLHFTMLRAIAWRRALDGDEFNAFRNLKRAADVAPSDGWRVMASTDRAYLADALGERRWAEQELSDAHELAARVPWTTLAGEERFALTLLAERYAPRDPALALAYVARYRETGKRFDAALASSDDRRVEAMESYSLGIVQRALGDRVEARRLLENAYEIYDRIGFAWRAARAALALASVTGDALWTARAAERLAPYPDSWLARPARSASPPDAPEAAALTAAQRSVYDLLLRGASTAEIATRQGRSEFTIRNHIKAILKAFDVNSRPALLAKARGAQTL